MSSNLQVLADRNVDVTGWMVWGKSGARMRIARRLKQKGEIVFFLEGREKPVHISKIYGYEQPAPEPTEVEKFLTPESIEGIRHTYKQALESGQINEYLSAIREWVPEEVQVILKEKHGIDLSDRPQPAQQPATPKPSKRGRRGYERGYKPEEHKMTSADYWELCHKAETPPPGQEFAIGTRIKIADLKHLNGTPIHYAGTETSIEGFDPEDGCYIAMVPGFGDVRPYRAWLKPEMFAAINLGVPA